jgi:Lon protease-like protein
MPMNAVYRSPGDLPAIVPLFPLSGALLLPRGQMPLNIFEPRYLAMVDEALGGARLIGIIQPDAERIAGSEPNLFSVGCVGRITQIAETGDGRYVLTLTGVCRFRVSEEIGVTTPFRQARVDYAEFVSDFEPRAGEEGTDREGVIEALRAFVEARDLEIDWDDIHSAPTEALVNALAMMSPFGPREKQALLEAPDLKTRADLLIAITEIELASESDASETPLQ